jgi:hypothetical protein
MKFTLAQLSLPVKDLEGNIIKRRNDKGEEMSDPLNVRQVLRTTLTTSIQQIQEDDKARFDNYDLAKKIMAVDPENNSVDIDITQVAALKKKVVYAWGIEVAGFVADILEGKNRDGLTVADNG